MFENCHRISRRCFVRRLATVGIFFAIGGLPKPALANVPTVAIDATKLEVNEFEVTVNIFHKGNNFFHYVDRVVLFADGEEVITLKYTLLFQPTSEATKEDGIASGDFISIEGVPNVEVEVKGLGESDVVTANRLVNPIPYVVQTRPGLLSMRDFPPSVPVW